MKNLGKALCALLAALLLAASPALAAEAPAVRVEAPREALTGDLVSISVEAADVSSLTADISASGLELVSYENDLCGVDHIFLMRGFSGLSATYTYRVTARTGEEATFSLTGCEAVANGERVSLSDTGASISVTGANIWTDPEADCVMFRASAGDAAEDGVCRVTVGTTEAGLSGTVVTSGLRFLRAYAEGLEEEACLSTEKSVILLRDSSGPVVVYEYALAAHEGEPASFGLTNVRMSDGDGDTFLPDAWWSTTASDHVTIDVAMVPDGETSYRMRSGCLGTLPAASGSPLSAGAMRESISGPADASIEIRDASGSLLDDGDQVGTGCEARLLSSGGDVLDSAVIVMRGDVIGSGTFGLSQVVRTAGALRGEVVLDGAYAKAADWNGNGRVDLADLVSLVQILRG